MSHFGVLVCLPGNLDLTTLEDHLADVMAPWDENSRVKPYRKYEDGAPEDYWWVGAVRDGAKHNREIVDLGLDACVASKVEKLLAMHDWRGQDVRARAEEAIRERLPEWADDAVWDEKLGEHPTWEMVVKLHNEKHHPGNEVALVDDDSEPDDRLHYDPQSDRAYTMSTYNPESKWDYWRIGGRARGRFLVKEDGAGLITTSPDWDSPEEKSDGRQRCNGGPKGLLDFEAMRADAEAEAHKRYDQWEAVCTDTPVAKPWSHFRGLADVKEMSIDDARKAYHAQPRIVKARETKLDDGWGGCIVEEFLPGRDEYVAAARAAAVPSYALVTLDGQWMAPGRMGWFGMSSDEAGDRQAYYVAANQHLDELADDNLIVVLDCHI